MSASLTFQKVVSGLASTSGSLTVSDDAAEIASPASVLAAQPATLTTRTNATSGTLTMTNASHGIITGQRVDLYWSGGTCHGAIAGTSSGSGSTVPIVSVAGGDNLPIVNTAITVGIAYQVAFDVTGTNVTALVCAKASTASRAYYNFLNVSTTVVLSVLLPSGGVYTWDGTGTNPLSGVTPTNVWISHESTAGADTGLSTVALRH